MAFIGKPVEKPGRKARRS